MKREIKYRGICSKTGEWVFGYYLSFVFEKYGGEFPQDETGHYILPIRVDVFGIPKQREEDEFVRVIPETVGAYVGFCDVNATDIYEGDIVSKHAYNGQEYMLDGVVEYHTDGFCLKCIKANKEANIGSYYAMSIHPDGKQLTKGEIIGNIYQNPDLLTTP